MRFKFMVVSIQGSTKNDFNDFKNDFPAQELFQEIYPADAISWSCSFTMKDFILL